MAEWFIKKITGDDLMDKALDLAIAEENANLIINALRPELQDIEAATEDQDPIVIRTEGGGGGTGGISLWQSRRFEEEYVTVAGSRSIFKVEGIGRLTEAYINHPSSNSFGAALIVDGHKWYDDVYSNLSQKGISDSHLAVYQDADSEEYIIQFSAVNFLKSLEVIVTSNNLIFDVIRVNYEMLVQ